MRHPPTIDEAEERGLLTDAKKGIHTFSNGSAWDGFASSNCYECWFFDKDTAGALCAFEAAAFMGIVSPELAEIFGWVQDKKWDKPDDHRDGWNEPEQCSYFAQRPDKGDDGETPPPPPEPDPQQLVLIADPTEDIALPEMLPELAEELVLSSVCAGMRE